MNLPFDPYSTMCKFSFNCFYRFKSSIFKIPFKIFIYLWIPTFLQSNVVCNFVLLFRTIIIK
jgi:hypothetical protein